MFLMTVPKTIPAATVLIIKIIIVIKKAVR